MKPRHLRVASLLLSLLALPAMLLPAMLLPEQGKALELALLAKPTADLGAKAPALASP